MQAVCPTRTVLTRRRRNEENLRIHEARPKDAFCVPSTRPTRSSRHPTLGHCIRRAWLGLVQETKRAPNVNTFRSTAECSTSSGVATPQSPPTPPPSQSTVYPFPLRRSGTLPVPSNEPASAYTQTKVRHFIQHNDPRRKPCCSPSPTPHSPPLPPPPRRPRSMTRALTAL